MDENRQKSERVKGKRGKAKLTRRQQGLYQTFSRTEEDSNYIQGVPHLQQKVVFPGSDTNCCHCSEHLEKVRLLKSLLGWGRAILKGKE